MADSEAAPVITIGKVRNADYYLHELHQDDAFTYYGSLERSGRWHGALAAEFGLDGAVDPEDFRAILDGARPDTGTSLTAFPIKVRALDATLSVPKSISVLWAVGDARAQRSIETALDRAEASVIRLLEAEAAIVRRGHAGLDHHAGTGLIVASFDHRTSRLGDPNLHRHLIVANASRGPDDRITGIDTRQLYQIRYTAEGSFRPCSDVSWPCRRPPRPPLRSLHARHLHPCHARSACRSGGGRCTSTRHNLEPELRAPSAANGNRWWLL